MEIALFADAFAPCGSERFIRNLALGGMVGQARPGPFNAASEGPLALWSESGKPCCPGVRAQLGLAGLPPNLDARLPLRADRLWRVPELHSEVPVQVAVLWATPLPAPVCQDTIVMGVLVLNPRKIAVPCTAVIAAMKSEGRTWL